MRPRYGGHRGHRRLTSQGASVRVSGFGTRSSSTSWGVGGEAAEMEISNSVRSRSWRPPLQTTGGGHPYLEEAVHFSQVKERVDPHVLGETLLSFWVVPGSPVGL